MSTLLFNPRDATFVADPYPHYRRLREQEPVHWSPVGAWFLGRYEDARQILRDPRFQVRDIPAQIERKNGILKRMQLSADQPASLDELILNSRYWLSFIESPGHMRIRRLVSKAFHPRAIDGLRAHVRESARDLVKRAAVNDEFDVMGDFARLLPSMVIAKLLGVPDPALPDLVVLTEHIARIFDPLMSLADYGRIDRAAGEFRAHLRALIETRRLEPREDLISALVHDHDSGDCLSEDELISTCTLLFCAGSETTVNLIGNGLLALLRDPEKLLFLRENPGCLGSAVEELLRYDAPLQMTSRSAIEEVELGGRTIRAGDQVYAVLGSANRDPEIFAHPDELDFSRAKNPHLAFAAGQHLCLGAMLARMEGQEAFGALLELLPGLTLVSEPVQWREHLVLRGVNSLTVRCRIH